MLVLAYLGCVLVSKIASGTDHRDLSYVPVVVVCFVLPFWYVSGRARRPWLRWPWVLLLTQCAVTYLGFGLFKDHWVGGVSGLLGGLVLLVVRSPWSWWLFALIAATEITVWLVVGLPYQPSVNAGGWVLVVFGNVALGVFGLTRLAVLVEQLATSQQVLAEAGVAAQRLATANDVRSTIMQRLEQLGEHVRNALNDRPAIEHRELRLAGEAARTAAAAARRMVIDTPPTLELAAVDDTEQTTSALASRTVTAVVVLFGAQYVLNLIFRFGETASVATAVLAFSVAIAMGVLQLRHSRFRPGDVRPDGWPWTLAAQAVLCFVAYPAFGVVSNAFVAFLGGSILLLIGARLRWILFGTTVSATPILTALNPSDMPGRGFQLQWSVYAAATFAAAGLLIYGLSRLNRTAGELDVARRQLAAAAVTRERLRIARDTHDALGLGLSTIALKSDLALTLLDRGDPRAHREIVHMLHLARTVASDAEAIVHGALALDFDAEVATAKDVLTSAGVTTTITGADIALNAVVESELAAIVREATTNILRHSNARECRVELDQRDGQILLVVDNDGAPPPASVLPGNGLANIATRTARMGGTTTTKVDRGRFTLAVQVPVDHRPNE